MNDFGDRFRRYRLLLAVLVGLVFAFTLAVSATTSLTASPSPLVGEGSVTPSDTPATTCQSGLVEVNILDFAFSPANVTVCAGSQVKWTNSDPFPHSATSDTNLWDSGTLNNGASFTFAFDTPGVYAYHCNFHSSMHGTITVVAGPPPSHFVYLPLINK